MTTTNSISFRDKGLRHASADMLQDGVIDGEEANRLIESAKDGPGLSKTETRDLTRLLQNYETKMTAGAKTALHNFLGTGA